jgi:hypothetical protein
MQKVAAIDKGGVLWSAYLGVVGHDVGMSGSSGQVCGDDSARAVDRTDIVGLVLGVVYRRGGLEMELCASRKL